MNLRARLKRLEPKPGLRALEVWRPAYAEGRFTCEALGLTLDGAALSQRSRRYPAVQIVRVIYDP